MLSRFTHILAMLNWPLAFVIIVTLFYFIIIIKSNKQLSVLKAELYNNASDPEKCVSLTEQYIKRNPFSQSNSSLRILMIPLLLTPQNQKKLNITIRKIRAVDIDVAIADQALFALFVLKENSYSSEYILLKDKLEKRYKPFRQSVYALLIQESIDFEKIENVDVSTCTEQIRAILAYYKGISYTQQGLPDYANAEFEIAKKSIPHLTSLLNRRGITR